MIENKCSIHLGVNLRKVQVEAVSQLAHTKRAENDHGRSSEDDISESDDSMFSENVTLGDDLSGDENSDNGEKLDKNSSGIYHNIDLFVCEVAMLFGHLGTLENVDGTSFHLFLAQKATECVGAEKEYYVNTQNVFLERQVWNRYYNYVHAMLDTYIFSEKQWWSF